MRDGKLARLEELTRIPADVQDSLITILSEKTLPVPELGTEVQARPGLQRDRHRQQPRQGRQRAVQRAAPAVQHGRAAAAGHRRGRGGDRHAGGSSSWARRCELPPKAAELAEIRRVVTVFRELRAGRTEDGRTAVKSPSGTLSTAEAISVLTGGLALAAHFGDGVLRPHDVAAGILGAVVKDPVSGRVMWAEYLETVVRERDGWADFYRACRDLA